MCARYSIQEIAEIQNHKVFFDANILIYLFWPTGSTHWENIYSSAFGKLLRQRNKLMVDFLVISEIINRSHRSEYEKHLLYNQIEKGHLNYKRFRDSKEGKEALSDIYLVLEANILDTFTIIGKAFSKEEIQSFLSPDETLDFIDKGILNTCKENSCILFTHDKDYRIADVDILTANPALLR